MKKQVKFHGISYTVLFWLIMLLFLCLGLYLNKQSQPLPVFQGTLSYAEPHWKFGEKGKELYETRLADRHLFVPGKVYVLTTNLTYDGRQDPFPSAFITADNLEIEAYYHGNSVFRHSDAEKIFQHVKSIGVTSFAVSLGPDSQGKNFRIELRTPMDHSVYCRLPAVIFGDHEAQIRHVFLRCLPSIFIGAAITFAVIILVMLGNTVDGSQWIYIYFSLFALMIVLYKAMKNLFILYFWGNPFMAVLCEYFSVVACPIPLLMSYRYRLKPHYQMSFNLLIGLSILNLLGQLTLHFSGIRDVRDMVLFTHLWLLTAAVGMILIGLSVKKVTGERAVLRKLLPIVIGALIDMVHYYYHYFLDTTGEFYSIGDFIGLGLLVSLFLMIWEARRARIDAAREAERNIVLEKVAYTDALTGISNRAAFTKALTRIATGKNYGQKMLVVSADLNGLKQTNDQQGHSAGDRLIRRAAGALTDTLSTWGTVYRTGGDEFFAILQNVDESDWDEIHQRLTDRILEINEKEGMTLSIALGAAQLTDGNINRAIQLSDQRMYVQKKHQHETIKNI